MKLPETYIQHMQELLQEELDDYLRAMDEKPANALRVNTNKISPEEFRKIAPFELTPVPWCRNGFIYGENERPGTHPYYYAGLYYMQETSAMVPAAILPVADGDLVLDACCAPGGKSTALACKLHGTGLLVSNDISASRQNATLKNMERFGVTNAYITAADLNSLARRYPETFDKILLDAPCSGEGMFRRDPSLIRAWQEKGSAYYAPLQKELILAAAKMLKKGGQMVYSTCTFAKEEDEEVVQYLCSTMPDMHVIPVPDRYEGFMPGILEGFEDCVRLYPHRLRGEGHFAALLQKDGTAAKTAVKQHSDRMPKEAAEFMKLLSGRLKNGPVSCRNDQIYVLPDQEIDMNGIRVIRSGLHLGTVKNGRFEPSQALAFACTEDDFANCIHLDKDDPAVMKYLRGETIFCDEGKDGWVLVCIERWPLGFGRKQGKNIKNRIQKGYRML